MLEGCFSRFSQSIRLPEFLERQ
ncbi:hypothetical protein KIPB_015296, partial [Kipferlia bialata]|eukprot:g15296.t1